MDLGGKVDAARMRLSAARAQAASAQTMIRSTDRTARMAWMNWEGAKTLHRPFQEDAAEVKGFHKDAKACLSTANAQVMTASKMIKATGTTAAWNRRNT